MINKTDEIIESTEAILADGGKCWCLDLLNRLAKDSPESQSVLKNCLRDMLSSLLHLVRKYCGEEIYRKVEGKMRNGNDFLSKLSELVSLFLVHPSNNFITAVKAPFAVEYRPEQEGPDIRIRYNKDTTIGIEVTRPGIADSVNHSDPNDLRSIDERIREPMRKMFAALEGKSSQFAGNEVRIIALDISDYVDHVFFPISRSFETIRSVEGHLYGSLKATLTIDKKTGDIWSSAIRNDPESLPAMSDKEVYSFFRLRPQVAGVIYFWHFPWPIGAEWIYVVRSMLAINEFSGDVRKVPWDFAFKLCQVMNNGNPFVVDQLTNYKTLNEPCSW